MELRIFIRQKSVLNNQLVPIYYSGTSPFNLVATPGTLPVARQWATFPGWIDVTDHVSDIGKLKITWTIARDEEGLTVPGSNEIKKTVTNQLTFEGIAYQLIKNWLIDDVSSPLNSIEIKILDTSCGYYEGFVIKNKEINWCESGLCEYSINLKQMDEQINCMKRTLISDNWQGWFPKDGKPLNGKKHPRFAYCVEQRPNGTMLALWYIMGQTIAPAAMILILLIVTVINPLIFAINGIIAAINTIPGVSVNFINFVSPTAVFDSFTIYFVETAGCGREHPAPLIRDYISNVCDKCGISVNASTAPIFFAPSMTFETSTRGAITQKNYYYNACYFHPQTQRGIRRYESVNILGASPLNTTDFWIDENRPLLYLDMFLDNLKGVFNIEWKVRGGSLYILRKDSYLSSNYIYDFTHTSPDYLKIVEGICFEPNERRNPAMVKGLYTNDGTDFSEAGGANGTGQMNGIAEFGNTDDNPTFEGILDKTVQFGSTKFNLDGASTCYYYDALQQLANAGLLNLTTLFQTSAIAANLHNVGDYALLMQTEICALPKILIWNEDTYLNARCVTPKAAWDGIAPEPMPDVNPLYNTNFELWKARHAPKTKVLGSALVLGAAPDGIYQVAYLFGAPIQEQPALLVNYPMYFEPYYLDTLWDLFHWIDDPLHNPHLNYYWRCKIELCCDDINRLGLLNDGSNIALGQRVKLPFQYFQDGVLREITIDYEDSATYGKTIELSGTL